MNKSLLIVLPAIALAACSSSNSNDQDTITQNVTIPFSAEANGNLVGCDVQLSGVGSGSANADVLDFRFYVHDLTLVDSDNERYELSLDSNDWQYENVALLDFTNKDSSCSGSDKNTNTEVTGSVEIPEGIELSAIEFKIGVPSDLNHEDTVSAASPLNISGLHWNWQNGYKHMRLDVAPVGGVNSGSSTNWNFHLGSTNCSGDPQLNEVVTCGRQNRPVISLSNFEPTSDTIVIDYGVLIENSDLSTDAGGAPGCMSGATDLECEALFNQLGMDVTSGSMNSTYIQSVFYVQ